MDLNARIETNCKGGFLVNIDGAAPGQIRFRGFYGDYVLEAAGREYHATLGPQQEQALEGPG